MYNTPTAPNVRIVISDGSTSFRSSVVKLLSAHKNIEISAEVSTLSDTRKKVLELKPDVLIMDMTGFRTDSIALVRELWEQHSVPCIAMVGASIGEIPNNIFSSDFIKKPLNPSDLGAFCNSLYTKITLAAKIKKASPYKQPLDGAMPMVLSSAKSSKVEPILPTREDIVGLDRRAKDGYVVALGASTGGTDALECVIRSFPAAMPPVLVVQHMPPVFTKLYSERLNKSCAVNVKEAQDGDRLTQGMCLIAAGGFHMELKKDSKGYYVKCYQGEKVSGHCPSVDVLFSSVAETAGKKSIGALMTGMGADGARGLLKMHQNGAHTIGQNKETCIVYGMPMEAYKLGACSEQQPLENIGKTLCRRLTDGWVTPDQHH